MLIVGVRESEVEAVLCRGVGPELPPEARCPACGGDRLDVTEQSVAVFGTAASALNGTLAVSPIALFGRYGVSEEGGGGWRPGRPDVPPEYLRGYPGAC